MPLLPLVHSTALSTNECKRLSSRIRSLCPLPCPTGMELGNAQLLPAAAWVRHPREPPVLILVQLQLGSSGTATEPEQGRGLLSKDGGRGGAADNSGRACISARWRLLSALQPRFSAACRGLACCCARRRGAALMHRHAAHACSSNRRCRLPPPSCRIARTPSAQVRKLADGCWQAVKHELERCAVHCLALESFRGYGCRRARRCAARCLGIGMVCLKQATGGSVGQLV